MSQKLIFRLFCLENGIEGDREELAGGDFRFQGQWLESTTDLYHFRARYYEPESGRFVKCASYRQ